MDQQTTLWLFGTLITLLTIVIGGIAVALWNHVDHCKDVAATVARIDTNLDRVMKDIEKIGPRTHEAWNAAMAAKADLTRLTERLDKRQNQR